VVVNNVAPAVTGLSSAASVVGGAAQGVSLNLSATFTDPGVNDLHVASIDWGDGQGGAAAVNETLHSVAASHAYASGGVYTATLTLDDGDGGTATRSIVLYVSGSGIHGGVLQVVGTAGADALKVEKLADGSFAITDEARRTTRRVAPAAGEAVQSVLVLLGAGNDQLTVAGSIALPAVIDGGAGNDEIKGGNGNSVLIGGTGDDSLVGGTGRDILIGGLGADRLVANAGDDILVGGYTKHDGDLAALRSVMSEWSRTDVGYAGRVNDLQNGGGLNGATLFNNTTVYDDRATDVLTSDAVDSLTGGAGEDWFLSNFAGPGKLDNVTDAKSGELRSDVV
jgi:Ca2+-binding RTX toxin-like protein